MEIIMTSVKLKLNRNRLLKDGNYPLIIQVIHCRKKAWLSTSYRLTEREFDEPAQSARYVKGVNTKQRVGIINAEVRTMKAEMEEVVSDLSQGGEFTARDIITRYKQLHHIEKEKTPSLLLDYMEQRIGQKRDMKKKGIADAYRSTMRSLEKFVKGMPPVRLEDVDSRFVGRYVTYLASSGIKENTISYYLRNFRAVYNRAVRDGYVREGKKPFKDEKMRMSETDKRALGKEDLVKIANADLESCGEDIQLARDIFMFSYYSYGMSFVDIMSLKKANIVGGELNFISYSRTKTHQLLRVPILEQTQCYMDKYGSDSDYIFSFAVPQNPEKAYEHYRAKLKQTNRALDKLGKMLGIETHLTTYVARHTFATLARDAGNPYSLIGNALGHTTEGTTHIYMKSFELQSLKNLSYSIANF